MKRHDIESAIDAANDLEKYNYYTEMRERYNKYFKKRMFGNEEDEEELDAEDEQETLSERTYYQRMIGHELRDDLGNVLDFETGPYDHLNSTLKSYSFDIDEDLVEY